jgi:hypothetical protein
MGADRVFRNTGTQNTDAGELPRRKHTTWQKFEIKNFYPCWIKRVQNEEVLHRVKEELPSETCY